MLRKKEIFIVAALFLAAVLVTGRIRLWLDDIVAPFRNDFQSMLYLPRGDALKVIASGFDAPLADALFIKALVYFPQSTQHLHIIDESKMYIYELFDVVTELSPRFYRAYQVGSLFLTASASLDTNRRGLLLLQKGVDVYDKLEAEGNRADLDPRWLFHSLLATTQEVNIQSRLRAAGDVEGASGARIEAGKQFRLAAASPGAPQYIIDAARGFESVLKGRGDIEAARAAVLSVWTETYNQARQRGDEELAADLEKRIETVQKELDAIVMTRQLQTLLSQSGDRYLKAKGKPATSIDDLYKAGLVRSVPSSWPLDGIAEDKDTMIALPDGTFKSRILAIWETRQHMDLFLDSVILYRRVHQQAPPDLETLVKDGILASLPRPPLAALGQEYKYDPVSGATTSSVPDLPEPSAD